MRGELTALLPGAPNAFAGPKSVDGYTNTHTMADWCERRGDFPPSLCKEVRAYFANGAGKDVRSLISRRIDYDEEPIGVLNIHSNGLNLLGPATERMEIFQEMITPIVLNLARIVHSVPDSIKTGSMEAENTDA